MQTLVTAIVTVRVRPKRSLRLAADCHTFLPSQSILQGATHWYFIFLQLAYLLYTPKVKYIEFTKCAVSVPVCARMRLNNTAIHVFLVEVVT